MQVDRIVVVDNGSRNVEDVRRLCRASDRVELIELGANLDVEALNTGISHAVRKYDPEFILLLNDDTILYPNAIPKMLEVAQRSKLYQRIGRYVYQQQSPKLSGEGSL